MRISHIRKLTKLNGKLCVALQKTKQEYEVRQGMDAFRKSGKTLQELMTFLDV